MQDPSGSLGGAAAIRTGAGLRYSDGPFPSGVAMAQLALDLRSYPDEVRAHDHPHHQVILALEGALDMEIGTRSGRVDSGRGALVPAGTMHAFAGIGRNRFVTLDI